MRNTIDLFLKETDYYDKFTQFQVIAIIIIISFILTKYFDKTYGFIILLIAFIIYISETFVTINKDNTVNKNVTTMNKLIKLQNKIDQYISQNVKKMQKTSNVDEKRYNYIYKNSRLNHLYIDSNMIHFLYSILPLADYNQQEFYKFIMGTNNILKLRDEIEEFYKQNNDYPENISDMFQDSILLKTKTINNAHNFIYNIPKSNMMYSYVDSIVNRYNILISRNLDSIYKYYKHYNAIHGYNTSTKIISYNTTKPIDYFNDYVPILNSDNNKLISFYN